MIVAKQQFDEFIKDVESTKGSYEEMDRLISLLRNELDLTKKVDGNLAYELEINRLIIQLMFDILHMKIDQKNKFNQVINIIK